MTTNAEQIDITDNIDEIIFSYLNIENPKSFFLFAGAGSGKTRTLVNVLEKIKNEYGYCLQLKGKNVAVITYTNAACDEIKHRLKFNSLFVISTIHSFAWELIKNFHFDIKEWLDTDLKNKIEELTSEQAKGRPNTKTSIDRQKKIESKRKRLSNLNTIKRFTYNPNGENKSIDSLDHSEVISICADFLLNKNLMQDILTQKYPILLIDESQDTKKELIEAFFSIQINKKDCFSLGLFGDTMQRIYTDGKENIEQNLPTDWKKPEKNINHRCPKRIIKLINKIRANVDTHKQQPSEVKDKEDGMVKLFIIPAIVQNKIRIENEICKRMSEITGDALWSGENSNVKILTLEHQMAAKRMNFLELFEPLYKVDTLKTGLLDGSLSGLRFFTEMILPIINAYKKNDDFTIARIIRKYSPILSKENFNEKKDQIKLMAESEQKVDLLASLWNDNNIPKLIDILKNIAESGLFAIPESISPIVLRTKEEQKIANEENSAAVDDENENKDKIIDAWDIALNCNFDKLEKYAEYISGKARFGTHQGVKGLQFPRVMLILDDNEANGFLFSYEKLLGAKDLSQTDLKNEQEGKDNSIDRTRRLFYVTCSRAEKSLAIVAYTDNVNRLKEYVLTEEWFDESEVEIIMS